MKILSFGCGVQTVTLAAMSCLGEFELPDLAVFADTQWESRLTYDYLRQFAPWAKDRGLEIQTVTKGNLRADALDANRRFATIPLRTRQPNGKIGMLPRQCTREYKVCPVEQAIRRFLGLAKGEKYRGPSVELWLGISLDEVIRMKDNRTRWIQNRWPLIEKRMTRLDCLNWLKAHNIPIPAKSACIGCPFHDNAYFADMKKNRPDEWADAVDFDNRIRKHRIAIINPVFIHRSAVPLDQAKLDDGIDDLWGNECEGHCGI